jgi:hypothetical protein
MTAPKRWEVTSMTPRDRINDNGTVIDGYDVAFITGNGHAGTVFVPKVTYRPDTVAAAVDELAQRLDAVGMLTSDHLDA